MQDAGDPARNENGLYTLMGKTERKQKKQDDYKCIVTSSTKS